MFFLESITFAGSEDETTRASVKNISQGNWEALIPLNKHV